MRTFVLGGLVGLAASIASGCGGGGSADLPDALVGLHHPANPGWDANNLEIEADGSARWQVDGCDYIDSTDLRVTRDASGAFALTAADGSPTFSFAGETVQSVRVTIEEDDTLRLTLAASGGGTEIQSWLGGGICPSCSGGSLVPTAAPVACEDPFYE